MAYSYLETDVHVGSVDGGRPPQSKPSVRDLVETGALGVRQLLVLHRLLETGCLLPVEGRGSSIKLRYKLISS